MAIQNLFFLEVVCAREASKTITVQIGDVTKELESSVF